MTFYRYEFWFFSETLLAPNKEIFSAQRQQSKLSISIVFDVHQVKLRRASKNSPFGGNYLLFFEGLAVFLVVTLRVLNERVSLSIRPIF